MALSKLFNLFALSSLAVLVCNLGVSPVNALANDGHHMVKVKRAHGHEGVARRKRDSSQRCKTRSSTTASTTSTTSTPPAASTSTGGASSTPWSSSSSAWSEPSSTSSAAPAASSSSSISSSTKSGSGKLGLAWPNGDTDSLKNFVTSNTQYIYTWSEECPSSAASLGLKCMPMLWGSASDKLSAFKAKVVPGYANIAMGFNEVNEAKQANMDVGSAVSLWWKYLNPLKDQGYQLLAPVTSSNPDGYTWMQDFVSQCEGCQIDGITVHYYGTSAQDMITYIEKWSSFNKPIWVTEFACQNYNTANENNGQQCSESQVWEFYKTIVEYMEGNNNVVAYFPFGFMTDMQGVNTLDQLMNSDGSPTALGSTIINLSFS